MKSADNKGFTLLEMTIVMAVVALISGGILLGKDLIHAAELRATVQQIEQFDISYNTFKMKYGCIPGDCPNTEEQGFVGNFSIRLAYAQDQTDNLFARLNPISDAFAFTLIEFEVLIGDPNGNGNGRLDFEDNYEPPISWVMLHQAGMVDEYFEPESKKVLLPIPAHALITSTYNAPAFWFTNYFVPGRDSFGNESLIKEAGHYYTPVATLYPLPGASTITSADAEDIDRKLDNAVPTSGRMTASSAADVNIVNGPPYNPNVHRGSEGASSPYCVTTNNTYNVRNPAHLCSIMIRSTI